MKMDVELESIRSRLNKHNTPSWNPVFCAMLAHTVSKLVKESKLQCADMLISHYQVESSNASDTFAHVLRGMKLGIRKETINDSTLTSHALRAVTTHTLQVLQNGTVKISYW